MSLNKDNNEQLILHDIDYSAEEEADEEEHAEADDLEHKRQVRKMIEERLERKKLRAEFDELDGDLNLDDYDK